MTLDWLIKNLEQRLRQPLPGAIAHDVMRATPVGDIKPNFEHSVPPKPGAVLILLYQDRDVVKFPLIQRQEYLGAHSGQISLPGGKTEMNEDAIQTALREGHEEIGVKPHELTVIGRLSDFFVIPSNFLVTPIIATITTIPELNPDPREVRRIMYGNLAELVRQDAIKSKEIIAAGKYRMRAPHFEIEGEIVWGATAMILNELCYIIREVI